MNLFVRNKNNKKPPKDAKTDQELTPDNLTYQRERRMPYRKKIKCLEGKLEMRNISVSLFQPH